MDDFIQNQYNSGMYIWSTKEAAFIFVLVGNTFPSRIGVFIDKTEGIKSNSELMLL